MVETIKSIQTKVKLLQEEFEKTLKGNKAAAARARKLTLELEQLGKAFRKQSVAEMKASEK